MPHEAAAAVFVNGNGTVLDNWSGCAVVFLCANICCLSVYRSPSVLGSSALHIVHSEFRTQNDTLHGYCSSLRSNAEHKFSVERVYPHEPRSHVRRTNAKHTQTVRTSKTRATHTVIPLSTIVCVPIRKRVTKHKGNNVVRLLLSGWAGFRWWRKTSPT